MRYKSQIRRPMAILLSLLLILTFWPGAAFGDDLPTSEEALRAAIASADPGDSITIGSNITMTSGLTISKTVTLTSSGAYTLDMGNSTLSITNGNLTLSGNLKVTGNYATLVTVNNGGTLNQSGNAIVEQTGTGGYDTAITNNIGGKVNISNGMVNSAGGNGVNNYGTLEVTGGNISAESYAIMNHAGSTANISGGTIQSSTFALMNYGSASIEGGNFSGRVSTGTFGANHGTITVTLSAAPPVFPVTGVQFNPGNEFITALPAIPTGVVEGSESTIDLTGIAGTGVTFAIDSSSATELGTEVVNNEVNITPTESGNYNLVLMANGTGAASSQTFKLIIPITVSSASPSVPEITGAVMDEKNNYIRVTFSEGVYANNDQTGGIDKNDFDIAFIQNGGRVTGASIRWVDKIDVASSPSGGENQVDIKLNLVNGPPSGTETITISPKSNSIYNSAGVAVPSTESTGPLTLHVLLAQSFAEGYPKLGAAQATGSKKVEALVKVNVAGGLFYVLLPDGATSPTAQQIKDHANIDGKQVIVWGQQGISINETPVILSNAVMEHNTNYDLYMVAEAGNNNFSEVKKLDVKTPTGEAEWTIRAPLPTSLYITNVKYLNSEYIGVGENGTLIRSVDGTSWQKTTVGPGIDYLGGVAYGNGQYVAVGYVDYIAGRIFTSSDNGVSWSETAAAPSQDLNDVAYGNGKFVAVGRAGKILTSTDGESWTAHVITYPDKKKTSLLSIAYSDEKEKFVAVGMGSATDQHKGGIMTSIDGINWKFTYSSPTYTLWDVAYGNGLYMAVGGTNSGSGIILTSSDGITWAKPASSPGSSAFYAVDYDGSRFIVAGGSSSAFVAVSENGSSWETRTMPAGIAGLRTAAASGPTNLVVMGGYGNIYTSSNAGISWAYKTLGGTKTLKDVAWSGSIYVAVGVSGAIQTSLDGQTWTPRPSGTANDLNKVDYLGGRFIAVGKNGTILTSINGMDWTPQTSGTSRELKGLAYGDGRYVAVGGETDSNPVLLHSTDGGVTWTNFSTSLINRSFVSVAYGDGVFIAVMQYGQAYRYEVGTGGEFTHIPVADLGASACYPTDIIYANGKFAAVGGYGEVYLSSNKGGDWTKRTTDLNQLYCYGIAGGGGNLMAVGGNGKIMASPDSGVTWHLQPSGLTSNHYSSNNYIRLNGVVAGDDCFVAVGENGLVLQSEAFTVSEDINAGDVEIAKRALGRPGSETNIVTNMFLPSEGERDTAITWESSKPDYISTSGIVTRPSFGIGDQAVTLTATIGKGSASAQKTFVVVVREQENSDIALVEAAVAALTFNVIKGGNSAEINITGDLTLPATGINDTTITWVSNMPGSIANDGTVVRPAQGEPNVAVTLTATISKNSVSRTKTFYLTVKAEAGPTTPAHTATASAAALAPTVGADNAITLTVKDSSGVTDTTFTGTYDVTISGVGSTNGTYYGTFDGAPIETEGTLTKGVTFAAGVATPILKLQKAGGQIISFSIDGVATPQTNALTIAPVPGPPASMALTQDIKAPAVNGGRFSQQPILKLTDASGNLCTNNSSVQVTASKNDDGTWELAGTATVTAVNGIVTFTDLGATNAERVTGAQLIFTANVAVNTHLSAEVTLPAPSPPSSGGSSSTSAVVTPKTADFDKNPDNAGYKDVTVTLNSGSYSLSGILLGGKSLVKGTDYTVSGNTVTFQKTYLTTLKEGKHAFTFDMSGGADPTLTITITDQKSPDAEMDIPFVDVKAGDWFVNDVMWAYRAGFMQGTGKTAFGPDDALTRGMFATILGRMYGIDPAGYTGGSFEDVSIDSYCAPYVKWAAENGIVFGVSESLFEPNRPVSRQEMGAMIYRFMQYAGLELGAAGADRFNDESEIGSWALESVMSLRKTGIVSGKPGNLFDPIGTSTRAEVASVLKRISEYISK